jgi:hypothetical protein
MVAPLFYVTDVLGNILADNDPLTAAGVTRNFGTVVIPEGECGRQDEYYVYGFDNCDGFINALNAVSATAVNDSWHDHSWYAGERNAGWFRFLLGRCTLEHGHEHGFNFRSGCIG